MCIRDSEKTERVSPFVVDPDKVRLAEEIKAHKIAIRNKRKARAAD